MFLVIALRSFQSFLNKVHVSFGRPNAGWRLLLEGVKHIHRFRESNRVHRPIGVSVVRFNDLQNARPEPLLRLRRRRYPTELSDA
jgi:hypothetical protein